jgi:LAO/AO transport system kinase
VSVPVPAGELLARFDAGDVRALAKLITRVEDGEADDVLDLLYPRTGRAHVLGVTGPPGVGKSTLVERLALAYRARGLTVGIVCVDPSSPFTGGAILGDRVRMGSLAGDAGVFIRSMGTRGALGGLARTTGDVVRVLDAFGKDVVVVETVGVGQGEVEIVRMADTVLVIEVPGLGDSIQAIKAGILEIADVFVVNKADTAGADRVRGQIEGMLQLAPPAQPLASDWAPPILPTVATRGDGVEDVVAAVERHVAHLDAAGVREARRSERREADLKRILVAEALARFERSCGSDGPYRDVVRAVRDGSVSPYRAARQLLALPAPAAGGP